MTEDEIIDEIIADLTAGLIEADDAEIAAKIDSYDLDDATKEEIMESILDVREADKLADENTGDVEGLAESMAKEDNSEVTVTAEDEDNDGDLDNLSIEKKDSEDDTPEEVSQEDLESLRSLTGNSTEEADDPHDESKLNSNVIGALSAHRW